MVTWTWNIYWRVPPGNAVFTVTAKKDDKEGVLVHKRKI